MAGIATITFSDGYRMPIHEAEKFIAIQAYQLYRGHNPAYDEARATLRHVALPPSWIPEGYKQDPNDWVPEVQSKLTNIGIEQGMSQAIPSGDR